MITLEDALEYLGIGDDEEEVEQYPLIDGLVTRAIAEVERITGKYFGEAAATTHTISGTGTRFLRLPQTPAADPAPVVEREVTAGTWETVPATDYQIDDRTLVHNVGWCDGVRNYRITYTRGFADSSTDQEYQLARQAALEQVKQWWMAKDSDGLKGETIGGYSYTVDDSGQSAEPTEAMRSLRGWVYA